MPPRVSIDDLPEQTTPEATNMLIVQDSGVTKKISFTNLTDAIVPSELSDHLADAAGAHAASAISATPSSVTVDGTDVQTQLGQLVTAIDGIEVTGEPGMVVSDTPPEDTEVLWADTATEGVAPSQTVQVFVYTDEADVRPDADVVFWIPDPNELDDPFGGLVGDLVLRSTPDVVQGDNGVTNIWQGTSAEYDAIDPHDAGTVYIVVAT